MSETVLVGLMSLVGTLAGTFGGIWVTQKLTVYRVDRLEETVNKIDARIQEHEHVIIDTAVQEARIKNLENSVDLIKRGMEA